MVMYLTYRPTTAAAPETMGLFLPHYPQLDKIELPNAVERFNDLIKEDKNKITKDDWHNLIQVFMDYNVRVNQSIYLKISDDNPLDIFRVNVLQQRSHVVVLCQNLRWNKTR